MKNRTLRFAEETFEVRMRKSNANDAKLVNLLIQF